MKKKEKSPIRKFFNYFTNVLLVVIILILVIPSWRIAFQGWFQGLFLPEVELKESMRISVEEETVKWDLHDTSENYYAFNDFKGKPVIMSFWATWCPPCRAELPELKKLKQHFSGKAHVIAVSQETIDVIKESGLHDDYDFLYSTQGIPEVFNVSAYPTLVILNPTLEMVYHQSGAGELNTEANRRFIQNLMEKG